MLSNLVVDKIQEILGNKYRIYLSNAFARKFTNAVNKDINYQTFDEYAEIIPGVFTMMPTSYNVAPFLSYNTSYELSLWCPLDNVKVDANGVIIDEVPHNVYDDLETLRTTLSNTTIAFSDTIRGKMTFSEPVAGTSIDNTGAYKRVVVSVRGLINLTDKGNYGSDTVIKIGLVPTGSTEPIFYEMKGITSRSFGTTNDGITSQEQGKQLPDTDAQSSGNSFTFSYDNYEDSTNPVLAFFYDIACGKIVNEKGFELPLQIYFKGTLKTQWNAIIDVDFQLPQGESGIDSIKVSAVRIGE